MIDKLDELKANFAKYEQITGVLVQKKDGEYCLCAEGILAVTYGATITCGALNMDGGKYNLLVPLRVYDSLNLPKYVSNEDIRGWGEQLELTQKQVAVLNKSNYFLTWHELNDIIKLTFPQFILLLDILDKL